MSFTLKRNGFDPKGPVALIILDGVGIAKPGPGNAFLLAEPKTQLAWQDECRGKRLFTELCAHGPAVGLPTEEDMGNSEVGHNAMGCGQIYSQGARLVNESIQDGTFFKTDSWEAIVGGTVAKGKTIHLFGLLSDGNVHSHFDQVVGILDGIAKRGGKHIRVHPLLDGRDVAPDSGLKYIDMLETKLASLREDGCDARIGSGGGRMHCVMDRYESNWEIVRRGYEMMVHGHVDEGSITDEYTGYYRSAREAIEVARRVFPNKLDQYNPPFVVVSDNGEPVGRIVDGDAVINFNFRGDRAIEITKAFELTEFDKFDRARLGPIPRTVYAGLLEYDTEEHFPRQFLVPPPAIRNVLGDYLAAQQVTSYALAETHKFGHVTYFWNGNRSGKCHDELEVYEEVPSEPNEMIEGNPEMMAAEVTDKLVAAIDSGKFHFIRCNYANGDMVGHTGNIEASMRAVVALDRHLKVVVEKILSRNGIVAITADHGNCEELIDKDGKVKTSHTLNPVAFYILQSGHDGMFEIDTTGIKRPGIASVASTMLTLLGYIPPAMYEPSLVKLV